MFYSDRTRDASQNPCRAGLVCALREQVTPRIVSQLGVTGAVFVSRRSIISHSPFFTAVRLIRASQDFRLDRSYGLVSLENFLAAIYRLATCIKKNYYLD